MTREVVRSCEHLIVIAVLMMVAFGLSVPWAMLLSTGLILLAALAWFGRLLFVKRDALTSLAPSQCLCAIALSFFGLWQMLALLGADQNYWSLRRLDLPLRFALSLPLIMLFTRLRLSAPCLVLACAVGGMCAGLLGVYQYVIEGLRPVEGMAGHRILFGCLAALLGVFGFCAITESRRFTHKVCGLLGFVGAWAAIGSSESRAALVTYSLLIVLIFMFWIRKVKRVYLLAAFVALSVALVAAYHAKLFQVDVRIHEGFAQIHEYYEVENTASSLGARFEMWFAARLLFAESPLLGKGPRTFLPESQRLVRTEQVRPFGDGYKHAHSQYLDSLASTGIFGLFSLLFALWVPLGLFVRYLFDSDPEVKTFSMIGILLCVGYSFFSLTEAIFDRHMATMFYLIMVSVCVGQIAQRVDVLRDPLRYEWIKMNGSLWILGSLFMISCVIFVVAVGVRPVSEIGAVLALQSLNLDLNSSSLFLRLGAWINEQWGYSLVLLRALNVIVMLLLLGLLGCFFAVVRWMTLGATRDHGGRTDSLPEHAMLVFVMIAALVSMVSPHTIMVVGEFQPELMLMVLGLSACLALLIFHHVKRMAWYLLAICVLSVAAWLDARGWAFGVAAWVLLVLWRQFRAATGWLVVMGLNCLFYRMQTQWQGAGKEAGFSWWHVPGYAVHQNTGSWTDLAHVHVVAFVGVVILLCWFAWPHAAMVLRWRDVRAGCCDDERGVLQWVSGNVLIFAVVTVVALACMVSTQIGEQWLLVAPLWGSLAAVLWLLGTGGLLSTRRADSVNRPHSRVYKGSLLAILLLCVGFLWEEGVSQWRSYAPEARQWKALAKQLGPSDGVLIAPLTLVASAGPPDHYYRYRQFEEMVLKVHLSPYAALQRLFLSQSPRADNFRVVAPVAQQALIASALNLPPFHIVRSHVVGPYVGFRVRVSAQP